jgi:hypothetical protein
MTSQTLDFFYERNPNVVTLRSQTSESPPPPRPHLTATVVATKIFAPPPPSPPLPSALFGHNLPPLRAEQLAPYPPPLPPHPPSVVIPLAKIPPSLPAVDLSAVPPPLLRRFLRRALSELSSELATSPELVDDVSTYVEESLGLARLKSADAIAAEFVDVVGEGGASFRKSAPLFDRGSVAAVNNRIVETRFYLGPLRRGAVRRAGGPNFAHAEGLFRSDDRPRLSTQR